MRQHKALCGVLLVMMAGINVYAQEAVLPQTYRDAIRTATTPVPNNPAGNRDNLVKDANVRLNTRQEFIQYLRSKPEHIKRTQDLAFEATFRDMLKAVENGRVDEQSGGSATVSAAASAAERAGVTGLITGALESGAMTQSLEQSVLTLRGNGEGLFRFLTGQDVLPACASIEDTTCNPSPWNNLELSVSLNVSDSNTIVAKGNDPATGDPLAGLVTMDQRQFSAATARYVVVNSRDLRSSSYRNAWKVWYDKNKSKLQPAGNDLLKALDDFSNGFFKTDAKDPNGNLMKDTLGAVKSVYDVWMEQTEKDLRDTKNSSAAELTQVLINRFDILEKQMRDADPDFDAKLELAANAYARYFALTNQGLELGNKPMLTVEATYAQPTLQPKLVNGKVVFAWSPKGMGTANRGTVTLNGGVSFYTSPQPSDLSGATARWRDAQFALQFDRPLGGKDSPAVFTLGTYIQYQISPGILEIPDGTTAPGTGIPLPGSAKQLLAPKGTIAIVHAGVTLQLPNSGVKIPIGVSWANRTELLTGSEIRGHIGFTFDTHSLVLAGK